MEKTRLNKYLAACGVCSRRDGDRLIEEGAVLVNGKPAQAGMQVEAGDQVTVNGKPLQPPGEKVVLAYYKPRGVICTERDPHGGRILAREIDYPERVAYAGRLDKDSEGLLLLSNDGDLIEAMMRGSKGHEKEYIVRANRPWTEQAIANMRAGVYLEELDQTTRPCKIERMGAKSLRFILTQGLNRQIRRMCMTQGFRAVGIKRTRVINITLEGLKPGEYRELSREEMAALYRKCGLGTVGK